MKHSIALLLFLAGFAAKAEKMTCKYVSSEREITDGFLTDLTARFICNDKPVDFIGNNIFSSCKPQFVLSKFTDSLAPGESVNFTVQTYRVSGIDGSSRDSLMVRNARSKSGKILEPQTIIQHGKPVKCDPTQIEVNKL